MMRIIDKFEEADLSQWAKLASNAGNGTVFQTPGFAGFMKEQEGNEPFIFIGDNDGRYDLLLSGNIQYSSNRIIRPFSRRAIVNGGLVTHEGTNYEDILTFLEYVSGSLSGRAVYLEIRNLNDYAALDDVFTAAGFSRVPHLNFRVEVNSIEDALGNLNQSRRRQVRKSLDRGAEVVIDPEDAEIREFYTILSDTYRKKVKKPLPGEDFFLKFRRSGPGVFLLVRYDERIIGGIMCPVFGKRVIYEWYIAGEDGKYQGIYPSVLATWAAIEYAARNGIAFFDFMGAGSPDEAYGVRDFKSKFGGEQVEYGRYLKVFNKPVYSAGRMVFRKTRGGT